MNILNEIIAGHEINTDQLNVKFFIVKDKTDNHDIYSLIFHDARYAIPMIHMLDVANESFPNGITKTLAYRKYMDYVFDKQAHDPIWATFKPNIQKCAESLEALQNYIDKGTIGFKHITPEDRVLDVSKLEIFNMLDPDVVERACA